jgi:hypothetical protein
VWDVQQAEQEVHILTPTRYEGLSKPDFTGANSQAIKDNRRQSHLYPAEGREDWLNIQQRHIDVLKTLGHARGLSRVRE